MRAAGTSGLWVLFFWAAAGVLPSAASSPQELAQTSLILGIVSDDTGIPVEGVRVTRWLVGTTDLRQYEAITDGRGRFVFVSVAAGTWRIVAEMPGYASGAYGRRRPNGPDRLLTVSGDGSTSVPIGITVFGTDGVISGTVVDDRGEPAVGVTVRALARHARARDTLVVHFGAPAVTDDLGRYRLTVPAGEYAVIVPAGLTVTVPAGEAGPRFIAPGQRTPLGDRAAFAADGVHVYADAAAGRSIPPLLGSAGITGAYATAVHPPSPWMAGAQLMRVAPGEERRGVDLQLRLTATSHVGGRVVGPEGPVAGAPLRLMPFPVISAPTAGLDLAATVTGSDGTFTLLGVPPGEYVLLSDPRTRPATTTAALDAGAETTLTVPIGADISPPDRPASLSQVWGQMRVSVPAMGIDNVELRLQPGASVRGRVVFEGGPPAAELFRRSIALFAAATSFQSPFGVATLSTRAGDDGSFTTAEYPPGSYFPSVSPPSGWLTGAATLNGRDVLTQPFELGTESIDGLVVIFTKKSAAISGIARTAAGAPDPDAAVVIFPVKYRSGIAPAGMNQRFRQARVDPDGAFSLASLAEGDYFLAAVDDRLAIGWTDTGLLDAIAARATRVSLKDGDHLTRDLRTEVVR